NQYVTTLSSRGKGGQLYGVHHPGSNERPAVWYSKQETKSSGAGKVTQAALITPRLAFDGFIGLSGEVQEEPSYALRLSETAWQQLLNMTNGDSQTWGYEVSDPQMPQRLFSHIVKSGQLRVRPVNDPHCRDEKVEGMTGVVCTLREIDWQGSAVESSNVRFVVRAKKNDANIRYRIGQQWIPLGDSVPLSEFSAGQSIDFFVPNTTKQQVDQMTHHADSCPLLNLLQMNFFNQKVSSADHFALKSGGTPLSIPAQPDSQSTEASLLLIKSMTAEQSSVEAGERLQVTLQLNRAPQNGEKLYLRLNPLDSSVAQLLNLGQVRWQNQPLKLREGKWQEIAPGNNKSEYQIVLPTLPEANQGRLELQLSTQPPFEEEVNIQQASLRDDDNEQSGGVTQKIELEVRQTIGNRAAHDTFTITSRSDGILPDKPAMSFVQFSTEDAPLTQRGKLRFTAVNQTDKTIRGNSYVQYFPGMQIERPPSSGNFFNHEFTVPVGTIGVYVYANGQNVTGSSEQTQNVVLRMTLGEKSGQRTLQFRFLGPGYLGRNAQLKQFTMQPNFAVAGGEITFSLEGFNVVNTTSWYKVTCMNGSGFESIFTKNTYDLYDYQNKFINTAAFSADQAIDNIMYQQAREGRMLTFKLKVRDNIPANIQTTIQCKLENSGRKGTGLWSRLTVQTLSQEDATYSIRELTGEEDVEKATFTAIMRSSAYKPERLNYKLQLLNFSDEERRNTTVKYRFDRTGGPSGVLTSESGSIPVTLYENAPLLITVETKGIRAGDKRAELELSTTSTVKRTSARLLPAPLQIISLPATEVVAAPGSALSFAIKLDRQPYPGDQLFFKLVSTEGAPLTNILNLADAKLGMTTGEGESINLSQTGWIAHTISNLASQDLILTLPGKVPEVALPDGKKFTLWANGRGGMPGLRQPLAGYCPMKGQPCPLPGKTAPATQRYLAVTWAAVVT
ncbi:MAG: hypothetical protein ACRC5A_03195, partial [Enterobacteriaceae bacterium]